MNVFIATNLVKRYIWQVGNLLLSNKGKEERLLPIKQEILIEQTVWRSDGKERRSEKDRECDYLLPLSPSLSLSLQSPPSQGVYTLLRSPLCLFTHALSFMLHTHPPSPLTVCVDCAHQRSSVRTLLGQDSKTLGQAVCVSVCVLVRMCVCVCLEEV